MAVAVGPALRIEPHVSASTPGVYTALAELVAPATSFRLVAVITATALLGTEPAMGLLRLWDQTYNGFSQVRIYGTQTVVMHIPTVTVGDLVQVAAMPWLDDGGYWAGARVWIERAEITLVDFADVPATPSTWAPPNPPPQWSVADHASGTELTYTLGDGWGLAATSTAWRFRPLGADVWTTLPSQDTDGLQTLPFELSAGEPGVGIRYDGVADQFMSMNVGLSPSLNGTPVGSWAGRQNIYKLTWDWDEWVDGDARQEIVLATTATGSSSIPGGFPVWLVRGEVFPSYNADGLWSVYNLTARPSTSAHRNVGPPPNLTGRGVGWLRVSQSASTLLVESSPDGVTYATWFTETIDETKLTVHSAGHGFYADAHYSEAVEPLNGTSIILHSYEHIGPSGSEVLWDAAVDLAWAQAGPGVDWLTNGASNDPPFEFTNSGTYLAFWDGDDEIITTLPGQAWEVQGQQSTGAGTSVWGPTYVWTHHGGEDAPTPDTGGGGYGFDYGNDYGGT